ncbi:hypothetical protein V8J88_21265 [Massilia sp. W12]|uniref:hypothetical protein n=1 Tax=Massilia sp. W12 TaxID=3126507 RepID=UPI0030CDC4D1
MLDLNHPKTQHIFEAARIEDEIRRLLVAWRQNGPASALPQSAEYALQSSLAELHKLNQNHFGASGGIGNTLSALETAISHGDSNESWRAFIKLAEAPGENFGTWAI